MEKTNPHKLPPEFELRSILETDIASIYFYGNFVVFEANEGIILSYKTGFSILLKSLNILKAKPWVYISNRVNSYSLNANDIKYLNHIPSLKAVAVINYSEFSEMNAELEGRFFSKPFKTFNNIYDAAIWAKTFL